VDLSRVRPFSERELLKLPRPVFVSGDLHLLNGVPRVAIVGARKASAEGLELARNLATELVAHGVVVVSGLAEGVDTMAHAGAIAAGGRTIAVIGTATDRAYPAANSSMQRKIALEHLLVSQFARGSEVFPSNFIKRNRTMAVLTHASVIVEASDTSGSLSQASETMELGKPLFFMKGNLGKGLAWPERFRSAGAQVVESVRQIVDSIGA
jgi:DNA processing protein